MREILRLILADVRVLVISSFLSIPFRILRGDCSVTGGYVYRGAQYSNLYGRYIFVDYCSGRFSVYSAQWHRGMDNFGTHYDTCF